MRKIALFFLTQLSFWDLIYQITTGIPWRIALASVPFVVFATLTGLSWWKGLKAIYLRRQAKRQANAASFPSSDPRSGTDF